MQLYSNWTLLGHHCRELNIIYRLLSKLLKGFFFFTWESRIHTRILYQPVNNFRTYKQTLILLIAWNRALCDIDQSGLPERRVKTPYSYSTSNPLFLCCLSVFFFQPHCHRLLCIEWHDLQALLRFLSSCSHLMGTHALTKAGPPRFCSYLLFNNSISAG